MGIRVCTYVGVRMRVWMYGRCVSGVWRKEMRYFGE